MRRSASKINTFFRVVSVILLSTLIITFITTLNSSNRTKELQDDWSHYQRTSAKKNLLLSQLRATLGYGGYIHNFKNFVLRQERYLIIELQDKLTTLILLVNAYKLLPMTVEERRAIDTLVQTIHDYHSKVMTIEQMADQNVSPKEIDNIVAVNDQNAIRALNSLEKYQIEELMSHGSKMNTQFYEMVQVQQFSGTTHTILLLLLLVFALWFMKTQLLTPIQRLVKALNAIDPKRPEVKRLDIGIHEDNSEIGQLLRSSNEFIVAVKEHLRSSQQVEQEIRIYSEKLQSILDNAADAIITIDTNGIITSFNPAAERIFNYQTQEVIGQNVAVIVDPFEKNKHDSYIKKHINTGEKNIIGIGREVQGQKKDGSIFPIHLAVSRNEVDNHISFTGIIRELTNEKAILNDLLHSKTITEKANNAKSEFLSRMSHELRTPMNSILGFTQLLEFDESLTADQKDNIHEISKSANLLLHLINEVLDLAKVESGNIDFHIETVNAKKLVDECLSTVQVLASERAISLSHNISDDDFVLADPIRLKQIILNLISNAIKYNKNNGSVFIELQHVSNNLFRIQVTDTGFGIPQDKLDEIFKPFSRLNERTSKIEGTGIGLTLSKQLIKMMKGQIGVKSRIGIGSCFWIELPSSTSLQNESPAQNLMIDKKHSIDIDIPEKTLVLYIEDNLASIKLMSNLLSKNNNINFISARNSQLGIALAYLHRPDLILLDINLPDMNGDQILEQLRKDSTFEQIPMIALSANAMPEEIEKCKSLGFDEYLTKPLDITMFKDVLETYFSNHRHSDNDNAE